MSGRNDLGALCLKESPDVRGKPEAAEPGAGLARTLLRTRDLQDVDHTAIGSDRPAHVSRAKHRELTRTTTGVRKQEDEEKRP